MKKSLSLDNVISYYIIALCVALFKIRIIKLIIYIVLCQVTNKFITTKNQKFAQVNLSKRKQINHLVENYQQNNKN